ncbi:hypothetical protein DFJ74DRAFT_762695 [Hyaloraphidium curvatum]|nr:hypothetical protein DFJ74DRAFT_762695 [Hyaloraphidium curvatum]
MSADLANPSFSVKRNAIGTTRLDDTKLSSELADGEALLRIERFGFTSNNVTYAAIGDRFKYFDFFPAPEGFGVMPVWGIAVVEKTTPAAKLAAGERVYGYWPVDKWIKFRPEAVTASGFRVDRPQMDRSMAIYSNYTRLGADPAYDPSGDDFECLFRPLWTTGFWLGDVVLNHQPRLYGAKHVIITSASAKTSYSAGFCTLFMDKTVSVVGLTSQRNKSFVESMIGVCYTSVATYDDLDSLPPASEGVVIVDVAGDQKVLQSLWKKYGEEGCKGTITVGMSHFDPAAAGAAPAPGAVAPIKQEMFFAPTWIVQRTKELGPEAVEKLRSAAWAASKSNFPKWVGKVTHAFGPKEFEEVYLKMLNGKTDGSEGFIGSMWAKGEAAKI